MFPTDLQEMAKSREGQMADVRQEGALGYCA